MDITTIPEPIIWVQTGFAIMAFGFAMAALIIAWLGNTSKKWLTTKGTIVISEVHKIQRKPKFFPRIKYQYHVRNRSFRSRILFIGHFIKSYSEGYSENMVNLYPEGLETKVYYNPSYPALSVLEPGIKKEIIANLVGRMVICIFLYLLLNPFILKFLMNWFKE